MKKKKKKPIIALAPIKYFDISRRHNLEKIKIYIKRAKKSDADIICFPESCVHRTETLDFKDDLIKEIREECKRNSIWCIITEDLMLAGKPYNTSILIDREGVIKGKYKKVHLYGDDVKPGNKVRVFNTDFGKIGIIICWDLAFPQMFKKMKEAGAEIVFCPSQWLYERKAYSNYGKEREINLLKSLVTARAFENLFYVAICNPLRDYKDLVSYSAIVSPTKVIKETIDKERLMTAKIDLEEIGRMEDLFGKK
jgi:predicted amidohydrolase